MEIEALPAPAGANELWDKGWFVDPGAYVIVDGQFGSTGKGALAAYLATIGQHKINIVTTNAGPNSGHTGYMPHDAGGNRIITRQIPVGGVVLNNLLKKPTVYLNGGAIIDMEVLRDEMSVHGFKEIVIHPTAAVILPEYKNEEADGGPGKIASTGKGVGAALAHKVMRDGQVAKDFLPNAEAYRWDWSKDVVLVETAQGFSLGINQGFYPHTTSRECTVMQAIADACIPPRRVNKVAMCIRTYPIRVGNTDRGNSGGHYPDQRETSWEEIGQPPELTTVTGRVRRVFTFSDQQFREALRANEPDLVFVTFLDYLNGFQAREFMNNALHIYQSEMGQRPDLLLGSFGPRIEDIRVWDPDTEDFE